MNGHNWIHPTKISSLTYYIFLVNTSMQKIKDIDVLFPEILMTRVLESNWREHLIYNLWTRIFPDMVFVQETENFDVFHFRLLPANSNDTISRKVKKLHFGPFYRFLGKQEFFWKIHFCHFFVFRFLLPWRTAKITNEQIPRKVGSGRTEGHTDMFLFVLEYSFHFFFKFIETIWNSS